MGSTLKSEAISQCLLADSIIRGLKVESTLKSEAISQCLLADSIIRGLKVGSTLRVRPSASACWLTVSSED